MKNKKRLSLIFDAALKEAASDIAKEMGYKTICKNDAIAYAKPRSLFSKVISFAGLATFHEYRSEDSDSGLTSSDKVWI